MNTENDRNIDELIGSILEDHVSVNVERRLRSQLENFRRQLGEANSPVARNPMTPGRRVWFGISLTAAAAIAAVLISWSLAPGVSLADVAVAVLQQPWVHMTRIEPGGKTSECWYSPSKDISAWRDGDWIEYRDHRVKVYYAYDLHDKVLYRVPEEMRRGMEDFASLIESLRVLMQSTQQVDNPLERLGLLGQKRTQAEMVKQKMEKVEEDGMKWLDYHLTLMWHEPKMPQPVEIQLLFRVEPETKLLRRSRYSYKIQENDRATIMDWRYDYPEKGPADVYDIGVSKTAKLIDRVPTNDLARILETLRADRQRMDSYRAILVQRVEGSCRPIGFPEVICRKGDRFRRDTAIWTDPSIMNDPNVNWPKGDKDAGDWWKKWIKDHYFLLPMSIDRGSTAYTIHTDCTTDSDGSVHHNIASVEKREDRSRPRRDLPGALGLDARVRMSAALGDPTRDDGCRA